LIAKTNPLHSLFFGKTKVMAKALGSTPETAYQTNTHLLAPYLAGNVGLLFTDRSPEDVAAHFAANTPTDFARAGTRATRRFAIPEGIVYSLGGEVAAEDDVPMAHGLEPELRRLNVPTSLSKGKITLQNEYEVCREGQVLDSRQTRLLKLFGVATAEFRVRVVAYWSAESGSVEEVDGEAPEAMEE
jgi:mRNA turnover protein 4